MIETIKLATTPNTPPVSSLSYNFGPSSINNFISTQSLKLSPLISLSNTLEYDFEDVNYVLAFSVRFKIVDDGPTSKINKL